MRSNHLITTGALVGALLMANSSQAVLTGHWEFEEGSGGTAANSVAGGAPGVITNATTGGLGTDGSVWVNDPVFGSVISFNGLGDGAFVSAGSIPVLDINQDFTWAFIANNLATQPNNIIVGNRYDNSGTNTDFSPRQFTKFTPTNFEFHMNDNGNDNVNIPDMLVDDWNHHAVVKDGAELTYYRNGNVFGTQTITQPQTFSMPLYFGGDPTGSDGENWHGLLDDVRTYDNALSQSEIQALLPPELVFTPGDVTGDGQVNIDDFEVIRANFLTTVMNRDEGDLNKDRFVDFDDYNEFRTEFLAAGGDLASLTAIPEPASSALLAALAAAGLLRRRA